MIPHPIHSHPLTYPIKACGESALLVHYGDRSHATGFHSRPHKESLLKEPGPPYEVLRGSSVLHTRAQKHRTSKLRNELYSKGNERWDGRKVEGECLVFLQDAISCSYDNFMHLRTSLHCPFEGLCGRCFLCKLFELLLDDGIAKTNVL